MNTQDAERQVFEHSKRADVDALLADPSYYEPRIAKTPLPRVRLRQAVQQWDAMQARHEPPDRLVGAVL